MDTIISLISVADNFDSTMYSQGLYRDQETRNLQIPTKIAVLKETLNTSGLQEEVKSNFLLGIEKIKETGTQIDFVSFDMVDYLIPTYYILTTAEASSNLSRYDGVRYGKRVATESLAEMYSATRSSFFGWEVKKRIMLGSFVLSEEYYDAYYTKAQQVRNLIRDKIGEILNRYDVIALPTTASVAWSRDEILDPMTVYMSDIYTVLASLCGFPAISIPSGKNGEGNHIGMQIIGKPKADKELIAIAGQFYEHINAF
jgi:aspartyl-tRNA(Asn)/glutamyl-tRNA(Gln) amidotransferase subunit A